jgi:hypothetical protein
MDADNDMNKIKENTFEKEAVIEGINFNELIEKSKKLI